MNFNQDFLHWQADYRPSAYWLAFSGGRDSVAMLDWLAQTDLAAPLTLCHVHHGWSAQADVWAEWCVVKAAEYGVPCEVVRVAMGDTQGESMEAVARDKRYQALARVLPPRGALLTAHHQEDQAETFLLAALRGSGLQGLAAMPARKTFARGEHWRPWLGVPRAAIEAYVAEKRLDFIDDPSNADLHLRRNALRHQVFPALKAQGWQAAQALAQSAQWVGEALTVQDALLDKILPHPLRNPLPWQDFSNESAALQAAVVRRFLQRAGWPLPPKARLHEWLRQVNAGGGEPLLAYDAWRVVCYRKQVFLYREVPIGAPPEVAADAFWAGVGRLQLDHAPPHMRLQWAIGRGGMAFHKEGHAHGKTLKDAWQKAGVPNFERMRTPVLLGDEQVLWAGHLGCAQGFAALRVKWQEKPYSVSICA